jgi:hypothetical protein
VSSRRAALSHTHKKTQLSHAQENAALFVSHTAHARPLFFSFLLLVLFVFRCSIVSLDESLGHHTASSLPLSLFARARLVNAPDASSAAVAAHVVRVVAEVSVAVMSFRKRHARM